MLEFKIFFVCFRRALSSTQLQEEGTLPFGGLVYGRLRLEEGTSQIRVRIEFILTLIVFSNMIKIDVLR